MWTVLVWFYLLGRLGVDSVTGWVGEWGFGVAVVFLFLFLFSAFGCFEVLCFALLLVGEKGGGERR